MPRSNSGLQCGQDLGRTVVMDLAAASAHIEGALPSAPVSSLEPGHGLRISEVSRKWHPKAERISPNLPRHEDADLGQGRGGSL